MEANFTVLSLLFVLAATTFWTERGAMKRLAVGAVTLVLLLAACGTGVHDEKGWNKALKRGYPCGELLDIAQDLPSSIDPQKVAEDLRRAGCEPPSATTGPS